MALDLKIDFDFSALLRKQKIILPILAVALGLIVAIGIYNKQKQKTASIKEKIKEEEALSELAAVVLSKIEKFSKYQDEFVIEDSVVIVNKISDFALDSGVKMLSITPKRRSISGIFEIASFNLKVEGSYHQIGSFLSLAESSATIFDIARLEISKQTSLRGRKKESRVKVSPASILINAVYLSREVKK